MPAKTDKPPCLCGHEHKAHDHSKRTGMGCKTAECSCIAYHLTPYVWGSSDLAREMEHWAHRVGLPSGRKQMTPEQCQKALARERHKQRRLILTREIEALAIQQKLTRQRFEYERKDYRKAMRRIADELAGKYARLAAIPEVRYGERKRRAA